MNKTLFSLAIFAFFLSLFAEKANAQASGLEARTLHVPSQRKLGRLSCSSGYRQHLGYTPMERPDSDWHDPNRGNHQICVASGIRPELLPVPIWTLAQWGRRLDRQSMIITPTGLVVGIGEMNPVFHLDVVGNTHTSGNFWGRIHFDNNPLDDAPNTYFNEAYFERKMRSVLTVPAVAGINNFGGTLSLSPGGGAYDHQMFFGQDGIWNRREVDGAASWSAAWEKLLSSADINGRENMLARYMPPGPITSTLRDGQVFDNGTNVVIGGIPAFPAAPAPSFIASDELTVQGDARVEDNLVVEDNATVTGSTTTGTLSVTTNATVNGNMGIGVAPTLNRLEVSGNSRFVGNINLVETAPNTNGDLTMDGNLQVDRNARVDGRMFVGAPNPVHPGALVHTLYVGGSIETEEVVVKLQGSWPDYVLAENYDLKPLSEVEAFVQKEKHLPGIASAKEVADNGLKLGEMQKAQMEKIEELYLHMIAMEKRMNALEAENKALKQALSNQSSEPKK